MTETATVSIKDRLIAILAEQALLEPEAIREDATLEELGIDSLGIVEVVFSIEEAFDIQVPFNANEPQSSDFDISSVEAMARGVEKLIADKA
jgi:acyl carrier protein